MENKLKQIFEKHKNEGVYMTTSAIKYSLDDFEMFKKYLPNDWKEHIIDYDAEGCPVFDDKSMRETFNMNLKKEKDKIAAWYNNRLYCGD